MSTPTLDRLRGAPKVLLHDHLDGGLRPATIVELADETGYEGLPTRDVGELAAWMTRGADRKDLVLVARECALDLAADGIVYAEVRYAPEQHLERGLALDDVVEAVQEGFREGSRDAGIRIRYSCASPMIVRQMPQNLKPCSRISGSVRSAKVLSYSAT